MSQGKMSVVVGVLMCTLALGIGSVMAQSGTGEASEGAATVASKSPSTALNLGQMKSSSATMVKDIQGWVKDLESRRDEEDPGTELYNCINRVLTTVKTSESTALGKDPAIQQATKKEQSVVDEYNVIVSAHSKANTEFLGLSKQCPDMAGVAAGEGDGEGDGTPTVEANGGVGSIENTDSTGSFTGEQDSFGGLSGSEGTNSSDQIGNVITSADGTQN